MKHSPEDLSRASQHAAAFLAHYASGDGLGMSTVYSQVHPLNIPAVEAFVYAMASLATGYIERSGKRTGRGREDFADAMRMLAAARADDDRRRDDDS